MIIMFKSSRLYQDNKTDVHFKYDLTLKLLLDNKELLLKKICSKAKKCNI